MPKYVDSNNLQYYNEKINKVIQDGDSLNNTVTVELGTNGSLGGYKTGDTISAGTPIKNVIKKLLAKQIPPTYTSPSVQIVNNGGSASGQYEYGTTITPKIKITFNQNDAGSLTKISALKNNVWHAESNSSPMTYEENSFTLSETVSFKGSVIYNEGAIKNDNLGEPYPTGHILAGTKDSNVYTFTPYRPGFFWGILNTSSEEAPLTSELIRSGQKRNGAYVSCSITGIEASAVENRKRIFVACPKANTGVTKVIMPSAMNADCTTDFVKQDATVVVEGANGYDGIEYSVWVYEPALISDDQTFAVTLG